MPRRSNAFQDLVALIEKQLSPFGANVYESKLLRDRRSGQDREVDIVIETIAGIHPIRIGIEVIDRSRPASTPWIESVAAKHEDLPIDKTIVVSRSGFYKPALVKAEALKIDALMIEQAMTSDWNAKIDNLSSIEIVSVIKPYLTKAAILFDDEDSKDEFQGADLSNLQLYLPSGDTRGTMREILEKMLKRNDVLEEIRKKAISDIGMVIDGEFRPEEGSYVLGPSKRRYIVVGIEFAAKYLEQVHQTTFLVRNMVRIHM